MLLGGVELVMTLLPPALVQPISVDQPALGPTPKVRRVAHQLSVARGRLRVLRAGQRRRRVEARPLQAHPLHLALLGLGKLRRYHD